MKPGKLFCKTEEVYFNLLRYWEHTVSGKQHYNQIVTNNKLISY